MNFTPSPCVRKTLCARIKESSYNCEKRKGNVYEHKRFGDL